MSELGNIIRSARRDKGWSQHTLASMSDVSRSRIALIEIKSIDCKFTTIYKLTKALDLDLVHVGRMLYAKERKNETN